MKTKIIRALIIEDSEFDFELILHQLKKGHFEIIHKLVENADGLLKALEEEWDVIISDYSLPNFNGFEALKICNEKGIDIPFITVSGTIGEDVAVDMMKAGAKDYIMKNNLPRLLPAIEREITDAKIRREKKQAEEELKESEERYRKVVNISPEAIIIHCNGKIVFVNPAAVKLAGVSNFNDLLGKSAIEFVHPDEREFVSKRISEIIKSGNSSSWLEERFIKMDGNIIYVETIGTPTTYKGNPAIQLIIRDITERKRKEEELHKSNSYLFNLIENTPGAIAVLDEKSIVQRINQRFSDYFGYNSREAVGKCINELIVPEEYFDEANKLCGDYELDNLTGKSTDTIRMDKYGNLKEVSIIGSHIRVDNKFIGIYAIYQDISERKRAEEILRKSESQLSNAAEMAHLGPWEYDVVKDEFTFNDHFYKVFRVTAEQVGGYKMTSSEYARRFVHPDDKQLVGEEVREAIETNDPAFSRQLEHRIIYDNGEVGYITVRFFIVKDKNGKTIKTYGVNQNITERKHAEVLLRESEKKYRDLIENMGEGIGIMDEKEKFIYANPAGEKIFGVGKGELINLGLENFVSGESLELIKNRTKERSQGKSSDYEIEVNSKDGSKKVISLNATPRFDDKKFKGTFGIFRDITERKVAEENIIKSQKLLQRIIDLLPIRIFWKDNNLKFLGCNEIFAKDAGKNSSEDLIGKDDFQMSWREQAEIYRDDDKSVITSGISKLNFEEPQTTPNGDKIWIKTNKVPLTDLQGNTIGILGSYEDITERKLAEEVLRKSELRFKQVSENASEWIWEVDKNGLYTYSNPVVKDILGYEPEEIVNKKYFYDFFAPENREKIKKAAFKSFEQKESFKDLINYNLHKDGREIILSTSGVPIIDSNGNLTGYRGVDVDITEQKRAEEALKESEKKYKDIFDFAPLGIYRSTRKGKFIVANKRLAEILGYESSEELMSLNKAENIFWDAGERERLIRKYESKGLTSNIEIKWKKKDGTPIWISLYLHTLNDDENNINFEGFIQDITARKQAEETLKKSEEKYRNLIETMPEGFYRSTPEGYFVDVNPALVKMLGYGSKEELMNINIPETLYFFKKERTEIVNYNVDFTPDTEIYRLRKKDGSELWIEDHARYIQDNSGKILYHEGIMRDITESLRAQKSILEAKEKAEESSKLKTSFLANMSHELRTPMVGILGFSELLKQDSENEETRAMAENIHLSGNRLMETLNLILDISRIEAGKLTLNYDYVDIIKVVKEVINTFEIQAKNNNLYLKLISKEKSLVSRLDERLIRQIINNLVNNAIKYTETGGVTVEISKDIINSKNYSVIKVKDTGMGIPEKFLTVIFDEFRQVSEGYGRSFEGTGLGLSIAEKFIQKLGGEISVESKLGSGSTFTVRFPVEPDKFFPTIISVDKSKENIEEETIAQGKPIKVLCVDDDEYSLLIAEKFLKEICDLVLVYNGIDAIKSAKKEKYSLILMDINLKPGIDGVETTKKIRKIPGYEKIPVIAVTAFAMKGDREKYLNLGFKYYLSKPYGQEEIISLVKKATKQ